LTCLDDGLQHAAALGAQSSGTTAKRWKMECAQDAGMRGQLWVATHSRYANYGNLAYCGYFSKAKYHVLEVEF
jgi:hypothetical protein